MKSKDFILSLVTLSIFLSCNKNKEDVLVVKSYNNKAQNLSGMSLPVEDVVKELVANLEQNILK